MNLTDQINADIKGAMLAKEKEKLAALRAIKSALLLEATKGGNDGVSEEAGQKILQKLLKQRKESADLYIQQGRQDLADEELAQATYIEPYLPAQMSEDEVKSIVDSTITELGVSSPAEMGKIMGVLMKKLAGQADGKLISKLVKETLG